MGEKQQGRAGLAGGFCIDYDLDRLEVDLDQLGRVHGRLGALRDDERYRLAHETDVPVGEWGPREDLRHRLKADAGGKARSEAVSTARTPGAADAAAPFTARIMAWARVDLTKAT